VYQGVTFSREVLDREGTLLRLTTAQDERYRLFVPLGRIPAVLQEATLLQEDRWFRSHPGVNPWATAKAFWETYVEGGRRRGASTITMQVARLRWGIQTRTVPGKVHQVLRALQLERHLTKDQILEAYLNLAPYGGNVEGVGAASRVYLHQDVTDITLPDALLLAVVPKNPVVRRPAGSGDTHAHPLWRARHALFARWVAHHPGDEAARPLVELPLDLRRPWELPFRAPHLVQHLLATRPEPTIRATLDAHLQEMLEGLVSQYLASQEQLLLTNASVLLVDARDASVLASLGSANFQDGRIQGQVDGTRARRSPGSALKPFIYGLALQHGVIHPRTMLKDSPVRMGGFNPENFDGQFSGPVDATAALVRSRNIPALRLARMLPGTGFYGFLQRAGIGKLRSAEDYGLSMVLGGVEVTMTELAGLYAMLRTGGIHRPLRLTVEEPVAPGERLLTGEAALLTLTMLRDTPRPRQHAALSFRLQDTPVSWKTGTSFAYRDAWAVGVVGSLVLAVWVGNFDGRGNPAFVGVQAAGPLFFHVVDALLADPSWRKFRAGPDTRGLNVREVEVCAVTGGMPTPHCPHRRQVAFIPGVSPIQPCDVHRPVEVEVASGKRACPGVARGPVRTEVHEFWPSDLLDLFREAGVPRRSPPRYVEGCGLASMEPQGAKPQITSPQDGVTYSLRGNLAAAQPIPLQAVTDGDARRLFWFVDDALVGQVASREPLLWDATPGSHHVRVVDDHGRSNTRRVDVVTVQ
jgi:penicillin-binding protein 1C